MHIKNIIFGILLHVVVKVENVWQVYGWFSNYVDEIIQSYKEETKTIPTNFNENKATYKMQNLYIWLVFLLIIIALLIAVSIYCYLIKYRAKQEHLLPFRFTSNKLEEIMY